MLHLWGDYFGGSCDVHHFQGEWQGRVVKWEILMSGLGYPVVDICVKSR